MNENERLFTLNELAKYNGQPGSLGLYLSFLGTVYNVSKGEKYYGPGGSYSFFAGKDATRAFITGEFKENDLIDDISDLELDSFGTVQDWQNFYQKEYDIIGRLVGKYYDSYGCPTSEIEYIQSMYDKYSQAQEIEHEDMTTFPVCNSEFYADNNYNRVWCTDMSGGQKRSWVGVPRKLYLPKQQTYRCACVRDSGPPSVSYVEYEDYDNQNLEKSNSKNNNVGDLKNPRLKEYENCDSKSTSCIVYVDESSNKNT